MLDVGGIMHCLSINTVKDIVTVSTSYVILVVNVLLLEIQLKNNVSFWLVYNGSLGFMNAHSLKTVFDASLLLIVVMELLEELMTFV